MNGMILQTPTENKDIKFSAKKGADTKSQEAGNLFENLIAQLVEGSEESENSNFLLGKLLNLSSDFTKKGKIFSDFSKGDIVLDEKGEEILLEDLFKIALSFKNDQPLEELDTLSKELKTTLSDKSVVAEFKEAKNIKELLNIANKHDIKVKNFQFFISDKALNPKDKQMVQKITSEDIFKMIETNEITKTKEPLSTQNILSKIIHHDKEKKGSEKSTLSTLLSKESDKEVKVEKMPLNEQKNSLSIKTETTKMSDKSIQSEEGILETEVENFQPKKPQKSSKNTLSALLNSEPTTTKDSKLTQQPLIKEEPTTKVEGETKEPAMEKNTHIGEMKSETIHKTKETATTDVKKTFNTFAMEFKEKVEAYKPPMMKINMQLSPKNLGDVDVTLITRGNNLHVNINTNSNNTLALFVQNQAEFKNSLVNMGFSDLQMNFGDSRGQQRDQNHKKEQEQQSDYHDSLENEETNGIEMILPNYV
jgi:flagellar hook-length control protein FliK